MKLTQLFFLFVLSGSCLAQNLQQEINEQVWKPFISSFNNRDAAGFLAVHSKQVVRSPLDSKIILTWDEYLKKQEEGNKISLDKGNTRSVYLRFTNRIAKDGTAIDIGIFKVIVNQPDGATRSVYGRFHVVMRKEQNIWKILVDMDSSEGNSIDETDFIAASPME